MSLLITRGLGVSEGTGGSGGDSALEVTILDPAQAIIVSDPQPEAVLEGDDLDVTIYVKETIVIKE